MSQLEAGVCVSRVDTSEWEPDDETGGLVHMLRGDEEVEAGLWIPGPVAGSKVHVELAANETILVLEGSGRIEVNGRTTVELSPGDIVSLPKGASTVWTVTPDFKEFWVYS